jgi:hypothetical protein
VVLKEFPPGVSRYWKETPLAADATIWACLELAAEFSRIMTPALAQELVFWTLLTRATNEPSPVMA